MSSQFPDLEPTAPRISAAELKSRIDRGQRVTILDTRRPADYEAWHVTADAVRSVNVPFTEFLDRQGEPVESIPEGVPEGDLVVNCAVGESSQFVGDLLVGEDSDRTVEVLDDGMQGWARLYEAIPLEVGEATVVQYHRPSSGCLAYMIVDEGEAAVIDPLRAFTDQYVAEAREYDAEVTYAIDTHVHADHVSGTRELAAETGATVVVPDGARERGLEYDDYRPVLEFDSLLVGSTTLSVEALPGHTSELVGFRVGDVLICGDTLFSDGVGRPDLEAGAEGARAAAGRLYESIQTIAEMPDETVIAPGHTASLTPSAGDTYAARLGDLRERLWAFDADRETFVDRVTADLPPRPNNYEQIIRVNLGKESVDGEAAFELELGPNNCAAA